MPLSSTAWKTIPWTLEKKSSKDKLLDIMTDIPGLLEDLDLVRACTTPSLADEMRRRLFNNCQNLDRTLSCWTHEVGDTIKTFDYTATGIPLRRPNTSEEIALLHLSNLYWMLCVLLYSITNYAQMPTAPGGHPQGNMSERPTPPRTSPAPLEAATINAYKIARSVHFLFEAQSGVFGAHAAFFPLGVALRFLIATEPPYQLSDERTMLVELFERPFMGTFVGRFLENLQRDILPHGSKQIQGMDGVYARAKIWHEGRSDSIG